MSIYIKEKPEYVEECFKSLLEQTEPADEWVIIEDGPLTDEVYRVLDKYQADNPGLIRRIPLPNNQGLGSALRVGVPECRNDLIARMDTDDFSRSDRFAKQLEMFRADSSLDICGSNIDEFEDDIHNIVAKRSVPTRHEDIVKYHKRRDGLNHVTVMFKKKAVLDAGNYESCPLMEDTYLWARMIMNGARCANINESLVFVRIGRDMFDRRGGWSYFQKYREGRQKVLETGFISRWDYIYTLAVQFLVALVPGKIRGVLFKKLLHR
ncbi:MAG: glycosyltransferase [Lachnospiraceae bacterium]|nr:glycosyltransferase [Lachnospiraceae bacterium]